MKEIVFTCDGPYDWMRDDVLGTCQQKATIDWDGAAPQGWIYTMMGADLCPDCERRARASNG